MKKYIRLSEQDVGGLSRLGIYVILAELSEAGVALREIGYDDEGKVVYKFPGFGKFCDRGLLDNATIDIANIVDSASVEEFDQLFKSA